MKFVQSYETRFGKGWIVWGDDGVLEYSHLPGFKGFKPNKFRQFKHGSNKFLIKSLMDYFNKGEPIKFSPKLRWGDLSQFHKTVYKACSKLKAGQVMTYGDLANKIGIKNGARAVGQALKINPFAPFVPCHRVVAANSIGGFGGKKFSHLKYAMLKIEGSV